MKLKTSTFYSKYLIGFKFIKEFIIAYPQYDVFIHGGAAAALHIFNLTGICVEINDIDFNIINVHNPGTLTSLAHLKQFINIFTTKYEIDPSSVLFEGDDMGYFLLNGVEMNFFIDQFEHGDYSTEYIFELPVQSGVDILNAGMEDYEGMSSDLESYREHGDTKFNHFFKKCNRKKNTMQHLKQALTNNIPF